MIENKNKFLDFLIMTVGTLIIAIGIYFFKFPNNFSTGGVSGISVVLCAVFENISAGTISLIINMVMLVVGFIFLGKDFGIKTVYCSALMSLSVYALELICPLEEPLTTHPLLELIIAIMLPAVGSAILFNVGGSTGGTDIVAMIIKKYSNMNVSLGLLIADSLIVMSTVFVFGIETWLFCVVGFLAKVFIVNRISVTINTSKYCTIVINPEFENAVSEFITNVLKKSATICKSCISAYNNDNKTIMFAVLTRKQSQILKKYVKSLDNKSFIIVTNSSEIVGKGFHEVV